MPLCNRVPTRVRGGLRRLDGLNGVFVVNGTPTAPTFPDNPDVQSSDIACPLSISDLLVTTKGITMPGGLIALEQTLLETSPGRAVFDALVQANLDLRSVPPNTIDRMLDAEIRRRIRSGGFGADNDLVC